jgi:electron transfer flavoprotein beta subunit
MQIFVCIKQVPSTETKLKIKADGSGIEIADIKWIPSPYDEFAIEEATKVKAANPGSVLTAIAAGPARVQEALRYTLALGADHALHVELPESADTYLTAKALSAAMKAQGGSIDLVFFGKMAIDSGSGAVPQMTAAFLGLPAVTIVQGIHYEPTQLKVKREIEGGAIEVLDVHLPAVISTQKGLNTPRIPSIPNMMKSKQKPIKTIDLASIGLSQKDQKVHLIKYELPPPKAAGVKLTGTPEHQVKDLIRILKDEKKVLSL